MLHTSIKPGLAVLLVAGMVFSITDPVLAADEAARVVGVRGAALVQSPGEEPRVVSHDGAIFAGDQITTAKGAGVGLLAGEHYVGLDESTTATIGLTEGGAPDVQVLSGRARVLASGDGAAARLGTATLVAANAGTDTDVFAFAEKAGLVAMICPNESAVQAARGGQALSPAKGNCAVAKRGEPLYLADAAHPALDVLADPGGYDVAGDPIARIGGPLPPVALGIEPDSIFATSVDPVLSDVRFPCQGTACTGSAALPPDPAPPLPPAPPINPARPGRAPI